MLVRVNSNAWQLAAMTVQSKKPNLAYWTNTVTLATGTNWVEVKAEDTSLNAGVMTAKYFVRVASPLVLATNGSGSLTVLTPPPVSTNQYYVGRSYSLSCVPPAGNLFSNVMANGTTVLYSATPAKTAQSGATVSFRMQTNLTLTGNFMPNRFIGAAGNYYGLFSDTNGVAHQSAGFITFKTTSQLKFTGSLYLEGEKVSFAGTFNLAGVGTLKKPALRKGMINEPINVVPQLDLTGAGRITGMVSNGAWSATIDADPQLAYTNNSWTWGLTGRQYTMVVPGSANAAAEPGGDGYSLISIAADANGAVWISAAGYFGDGQQGKPIKVPPSQAGRWPFYAPLCKYFRTPTAPAGPAVTTYRGSVLGWLRFTNSNVQGDLDWNKAGWTNGIYDAGFSNRIAVAGSPYVAPALLSGAHVIAITNGQATLSDGNLGAPVLTEFDWTDANKLVFAKPLTLANPNALTLTVNYKNGELKGSFLLNPPNKLSKRNIYGAVLQNLNLGYGNFKGTNQSGSILLQGN